MIKKLWAGVDIGGTKTAVLVSADPPQVLKRIEFPTLPANGPKPAIDKIKSSLHECLPKCAGPLSRASA